MAQAYGPGYRRCEPQPNRLPAAVADESPPVRLSSWNVYRHPDRCPNEFDFDLFGEPALLELPADLLSRRFAFSLSAPSEMVTRWAVRGHRLPDSRSLALEARRLRNIPVQRDEAHLPLIRVRASGSPREIPRRGRERRSTQGFQEPITAFGRKAPGHAARRSLPWRGSRISTRPDPATVKPPGPKNLPPEPDDFPGPITR